jgi:copper(I)-binding protein
MNALRVLVGLLPLALASASVAAVPECRPRIEGAWIRVAPPGATALAGYATLENPCPTEFSVTGATGDDFAMVMIHQTMESGGMSRMREMAALPIPAKGSAVLAPGGTHLMLMQPRRALKEGDRVAIDLQLGDGRTISAEFVVRRE